MNESRTLAQFVANTQFSDLPASLVASSKIAVLDALGAGFVGSLQPWTRRILSVIQGLGGAPEASVIHEPWRTDVGRAAFANGVLIGAFECEPLTGSHAAGTVLPAALAVCQRERGFSRRWRWGSRSLRASPAPPLGSRPSAGSTTPARRARSALPPPSASSWHSTRRT